MRLDSALKKIVPDISRPKKSGHFLMHWMSVKLPDNFQMREHSWPCRFHIKIKQDFHFTTLKGFKIIRSRSSGALMVEAQALVSFKKYMPSTLPYFKVYICPFPLPHFASIFFAYLWSFPWPNYIVTLPRYFSLRLPHLNIPTGPTSDELDKNISERSLFYF